MSDNIENMQNDHDNLITLIETVKNLQKGQDTFHAEMRKSIDDLQKNYTGKIDKNTSDIEELFSQRVAKKDFENVQVTLMKLRLSVDKFWIAMTLYSVAVWWMFGLLIYHVLN